MSQTVVSNALKHWGIHSDSIKLVAQRENLVYRISESSTGNTYALRLHRPGLRSEAELRSESQWLNALSTSGLDIALPVATTNGAWCIKTGDYWVDMQVWLQGDTIDHHAQASHYSTLGSAMARLHDASDNWALPHDFERPEWDRDGLVGESPLWGRFWDNPKLNAEQRLLLIQFRQAALLHLNEQHCALDYGLIHADLVSENVLINKHSLHLIDFDDSGFGYRLFDLATTVLRLQRLPGQEHLVDALIAGYVNERGLDLGTLDLFLALRACTYIGWIVPRAHEPEAAARCARFIKNGCLYVERWLEDAA